MHIAGMSHHRQQDDLRSFKPSRPWSEQPTWFALALVTIILSGLLRSWIATRHDGLQIDEAWHTVAGVSYARTGDYRLNPEHPPLVKLWVGVNLPESSFRLKSFYPLDDKAGEREFIDDVFYLDNDPDAAQSRSRLAMLAFHGTILLALGFALRRAFSGTLALLVVGLLLLDPTVAAHLPVVLTDLPLTLLSALSVVLAYSAFRSFRPLDLLLASLALGFALASKHSAIPVGLFVLGLGLLAALRKSQLPGRERGRRVLFVLAVGLGAYGVLWAFYGFRFDESPIATSLPTFNRPTVDKVSDLRSASYRALIQLTLDLKALPRAYLWGLADIIRAGVEGRQDVMYVFGHLVFGNTPWYFFPAVLLAKLPIGMWALTLTGAFFWIRRGTKDDWFAPSLVLVAWAAFYLLFIVRGNSGYAGIRHALPLYPALALLAAFSILCAFATMQRMQQVLVLSAAGALCLSALPVMRPWEYYNELAGGQDNAWQNFADDGLENGQRVKDLTAYYDAHIRDTHEPAYDFYDLYENQKKAYRLKFRELEEDLDDSEFVEGTVFVNARWLGPRPLYDYAAFRAATPIARFGNLLVLRGRFQIPWLRADRRLGKVWEALAPGKRDPARAEALLSEVVEIYPQDYQAAFTLGNLLVERGATELAIRAYALSREHAPKGDSIVNVLSRQIDALTTLGAVVGPLRNPWLE